MKLIVAPVSEILLALTLLRIGAVVSGVVNAIVAIDETFDAASLTTTYALYEVPGVKPVSVEVLGVAAEIAPVALARVGLAALCAIIAEDIGAEIPAS